MDQRQIWNTQYRSGGWDYLAGPDEAVRYRAIAGLLARYAPHGSMLDVGCGSGILLEHLPAAALARYTGIDLSDAALERARAFWPAVRFHRCDYEHEPVGGHYDCVIFNETLYCFDDPPAVLAKCRTDNLHAGSLLMVSMYGDHHDQLWNHLAQHYDSVDETIVGDNPRGVRWRVRAMLAQEPA